MGFRAAFPALAVLGCAFAAFLPLAWVDDGAQRARWIEVSGAARGRILDRLGRPLAWSSQTRDGVRRVYALPGLMASAGYRDPFQRWHGIEQQYASYLDGDAARNDWRTYFSHLIGQPARGGDLRLTIDTRIQATAEAALRGASGSIVAIDPKSGEVVAMVSNPSCNANRVEGMQAYERCTRDPRRPFLNRATSRLYAPGSAFKVVTLTAALDTGRFHLGDTFEGADAFGPSPYFDNLIYPSNVTRADLAKLTLSQALAFSDNFTFAHIGLMLGSRVLRRYAARFYLGRHIPFDLPVKASSIANGHARPTRRELAQSAFGAEVDRVTPLQMALVAAAVANHGVLMGPRLVLGPAHGRNRAAQTTAGAVLGRVMSRRTADAVTSAMEFVVDHGSGFRAQIRGVKVAGKTGTASSGASKPHAWFICFAPARNPIIAVAVLREYSGEGAEYAAPIARKVLLAALRDKARQGH